MSLAAVACSSGDDGEAAATVGALSPTVVDAETAYFAAIDEILETRERIGENIDDLIGDQFPTFAPDNIQAFVLLNALREAKIGELYAESQAMALALTPPEKYAADHAAFVAAGTRLVELASQIDEAVASEDLAHVHLAQAKLFGARDLSLLVGYSPEYCRRVVPDKTPLGNELTSEEIFCRAPDPIGGEYGVSIALAVTKFSAQFRPLAALSGVTPGMGGSDLIRATGYIQPLITDLFEEVTLELAQLVPPVEYAEGHDVLTQYYDELFATSKAIDVAVAEDDYDKMLREFQRSGEIREAMQDRMPENYKDLVPLLLDR